MQEPTEPSEGVSMSSDGKVLTKDGVEYRVGDHVYLHPDSFDQMEQAATAEVPDYAAKGRFHKVSEGCCHLACCLHDLSALHCASLLPRLLDNIDSVLCLAGLQ